MTIREKVVAFKKPGSTTVFFTKDDEEQLLKEATDFVRGEEAGEMPDTDLGVNLCNSILRIGVRESLPAFLSLRIVWDAPEFRVV